MTTLNPALAAKLAARNLRQHRIVSGATILGIALGMVVVGAILIVDGNTARAPGPQEQAINDNPAAPGWTPLEISSIAFVRQNEPARPRISLVPTQQRKGDALAAGARPSRRGAEDYQTMRLAVRLASLLAFSIGTVIVFYTMRFSVASRSRALSLLLCLGEFRANIALSLVVEALVLGAAGSVLGLLLSFPVARYLLMRGISTTGQTPLPGFAIPWFELGAMGSISIFIALLGIAGPVRSLFRMNTVAVLQPRFLADDAAAAAVAGKNLLWAVPPLLAAAYLLARPFLYTWLSVVAFFVVEAAVVVGLSVLTLLWVQPLLRFALRGLDSLLRPLFPLETLLAGRRMRLTSHKIVSSIIGVALVFSLLTCLHDVTRALKAEISTWAAEALSPFAYFESDGRGTSGAKLLQAKTSTSDLHFFRLSQKVAGEFPMRLISAEDVNPFRVAHGREPLLPGTVIFSKTLAARFGLAVGDATELTSRGQVHRFEVIDIADDIGYVTEPGLYVDLKSYALFSDGNPLFADNLEQTLGQYVAVRNVRGPHLDWDSRWTQMLAPDYRFLGLGESPGRWQVREIDRDFLIFDFVMLMTIALAAIGVANAMLMQVHARDREFSVLRAVGISRVQIFRLLLIESVIIGLLGALLAFALGHMLGLISVEFLDRFTLFEYRFVFSARAGVWTSALAVLTCCVAALYPALVAARPSSAESLHYE
jgi:putative ABC transport system permease protein